jgi:hypothetical protein
LLPAGRPAGHSATGLYPVRNHVFQAPPNVL